MIVKERSKLGCDLPYKKKRRQMLLLRFQKKDYYENKKRQKDQLRDDDNPGKKTIVRTVGMESETNSRETQRENI